MGDRAQIAVKQYNGENVYLYTHWDGYDIANILAGALKREQRWSDPEYLTRIIFCEMVKGDIDGETGYGIGTQEHEDIQHPVIHVDCHNQQITWSNPSWEHNQSDLPGKLSFDEFIEKYAN